MKNKLFFTKSIIVLLGMFLCVSQSNSQTSSSSVVHLSRISQGLQTPTRLAIDNLENIYVTDPYQKGIVKYDASGSYIGTINTGFKPLSIAINSSNQIFVGTAKDGKIYKIGASGLTTVFYTGCVMPSSMVFSPDGLLYIVDSELKKVLVLDVSANVVKTIGLGDLIYPTSIAYDTRKSRIFVGEHGGVGTGFTPSCKVWVYDLTGTLITSFGSNGSTSGKFYRIQGIAVGKCGNIYVNEPFQGDINVFDENLNYVTKFGYFGEAIGELNVPLDIIFDSQERILMTSMNNSSLEIFGVTDSLPTSNIANSDATICTGQTADISINFTGNAPWTFAYSIDGVAQTPITTLANPYTLTVSSGGLYEITSLADSSYNGTCFSGSALINEIVTTPTSSITSGNIILCEGNMANIPVNFTGTSPWTFTYTTNGINPTTITTANTQYVINTSDTGVYEVTNVSDAGCVGSATGSTTVSVNALPTSTITSSSLSICDGQSTNLSFNFTGTSPWTFTYTYNNQTPTTASTPNSSYSFPVTAAGTYTITTLADASCTNSTNLGSVDLIVNPLPTVIMDNITDSVCSNSFSPIPIHFTGNAPWTIDYSINNGTPITIANIYGNDSYIYANTAGNYTVYQVSDANCVGTNFSGSANISILPAAVPDFAVNGNGLTVNFINNSTNASSYLWDFGDNTTSTVTNPVHTYATLSTYQVTLTATNLQCGDNVLVIPVDLLTTSIDNVNTDEVITLYPNPSSGFVTMEINNPSNTVINIDIISAIGQKVYTNQFSNKKIKEQIDLSSHARGIYTVKITTENVTKTAKLILYK